MDALGGYGSSDSSENDSGDDKPKSALSGLLANLSDASDDDDDAHDAVAADKRTVDYGNETNDELPPKKKMRRGSEEGQDHDNVAHVLPPPQLLASTNNNTAQKADIKTDIGPFQSLLLSSKDYTSQLRKTLTQQSQSQRSDMSQKQNQLADRLKLLQETFQRSDETTQQTKQTNGSSNTDSSSFASHLKSKQEFGNPHLLKGIIDHFQITPMDAKKFKPFEFFDRLQVSEEKARIAAANYDAGNLS